MSTNILDQHQTSEQNCEPRSGLAGYDPENGVATVRTSGRDVAALRKGNATFIPLVCDAAAPIEQAPGIARAFIETLNLFPGENTALFDTLDEITAWATAHGHKNLLDLVDDAAEALICDLTDIETLDELDPRHSRRTHVPGLSRAQQQAAASRETEPLRIRAHQIRNTLMAMRAALVLTRPRGYRSRLVDDSLALGLPSLTPLEARTSRPLTDHEILLMRFLIELNIQEESNTRPSIALLLGESAVRTIPSTRARTDDLDSRTQPTNIEITTLWVLQRQRSLRDDEVETGFRTATLTDYAQATLPALLQKLPAGSQPLTFTGRGPGTVAAHNSVAAYVRRHLRRAGIDDPYVTTKSLAFWLPWRLLQNNDLAGALAAHGRRTINLLEDFKLVADEFPIARGEIDLLRKSDSKHIATVPIHDYNSDLSATRRLLQAS